MLIVEGIKTPLFSVRLARIASAILNVGSYLEVYSSIMVWQKFDQFLTTCVWQTYNPNPILKAVSIFGCKVSLQVSTWYWLCLEILILCDKNWVVVLIRFSTTNVLLALISKAVAEPRRIHFINVTKKGTCGMLKNYLQIDSQICCPNYPIIFLANLDNNLPSSASLSSFSYSFTVSACVSLVVNFSGSFFWLLGTKEILGRFSSTSSLSCLL